MAGRADSRLPRRRVPSAERKLILQCRRKESDMGYTTEFDGEFRLNKPLDDDTFYALEDLDGSYSNGELPDSYCQWKVGADWQSIKWDGGEKFYYYIEWIRAINRQYLLPKKYILNGEVLFQGESVKDCGRIVANDGKIEVYWNYDDPKLSNYDPKSKAKCHIPEGQGVHWISRDRNVFCDFGDSTWMDSETEDAEQSKMFGITLGNAKAVAVFIDVSATQGTNKEWRGFSSWGDKRRVRIMSIDTLLPLIDSERGARTRLADIFKAAKRVKRCHDAYWPFLSKQ